MEGIGAEVWQKIRSAIKAKLMELGAYIDEELPEYIMVMVGNKRSKTQMEEDLKLFLGTNSVHFTNWLHQVLQKLQEVTVPSLEVKKPSAATSVKRKSTDEPSKKKKKAKSSGDVIQKKSDKKTKDVINVVENKSKKESVKTNDTTSLLINDNSSDQENIDSHVKKPLPEPEIKVKVEKPTTVRTDNHIEISEQETDDINSRAIQIKKEKSPSICDNEDEDFLNIKADMEGEDLMEGDTDTYEEPVQKESSKPTTQRKQDSSDSDNETLKSVPKQRPSPPSSTKHADKKIDARLLLNRKTDARELLNKKAAARQAAHDNKRPLEKPSRREREYTPPRRHYDHDRSYNDRHASRRVIVSTQDTSNKTRKYDEDKDKSNADRSRSSSAGLRRKPNSEVNDNISSRDKIGDRLKRGHESSDVEVVKKSKVTSVLQKVKDDGRVRSSDSEENRKVGGVLSRVVPRRHEPEDNIDTPVPSVIKVTPRPRRPLSQQANHTLILKAMADANKSMASVLPRPDVQQMKPRLEAGVFTRTLREKNRIPPDKIAVSITNNRVSSQDKCSKSSKEDMKVEEKQEDVVNNRPSSALSENESENDSVASKVITSISEAEEDSDDVEPSDMIGEWLKGVNEARSNDIDLNNSKELISEEINVASAKGEDGPQFVVTLNGLDPELFFKDLDYEDLDEWEKSKVVENSGTENMDGRTMTGPESQGLKRKRPTSPIVIVKNTANNNNLVDVMEATKAKPVERCKYWPNCRTGDQCVYHHPITPCKAFPTCKFGEHCLFIHPQCKYNAACTRRGCPYSHTTSVLPPTPTVTKSIQACRFFPKCTNLNCSFFHPKICKFGSYCTKKDCTFSHNEVASVDKLKWSREGAT